MQALRKSGRCVLYHIDRLESQYGNVMIRGWAADLDPRRRTQLSVEDGLGARLEVYVERLVRPDVCAQFGRPETEACGFHILIDRAVLNTSFVYLVFTNGVRRQRVRVDIHTASAAGRFWQLQKFRHQAKRYQQMARSKTAGQLSAPPMLDYDLWARMQEPDARTRRLQQAHRFPRMPLFSVVIPLYETPLPFLKAVVDSVLRQTYPHLELCLADGSRDGQVRQFLAKHYAGERRLRYRRLKENKGISENTNAALAMARGEFLVFADHDDLLAPDALYELAAAVCADPDIDLLYTDEDKINRAGTAYFAPHFKPDFSMELLRCNNYICHLLAVRRDLLEKAGPLDAAYDGAQDYDFVLRCAEQARRIHHIPRVLYHWRTHPDSTAGNPASKEYAFEAGRRAVEAHCRRMGLDAAVEQTRLRGRYRVRYALPEHPLVSIVILNKDHVEELRRCLNSIWEKSSYDNYEILIVENNSTEAETEQYYESLAGRVRLLRYEGCFNFAAIHNFAVPRASGEYVVLLNNDTEVQSSAWLEELLGLCQKPEVGAAGAKLFYPDGTIQHAGVALGLCGVASHLFAGADGTKDGYAGRLVSVQDYSAVTAACMMTKKSVYLRAGGMEEALAVAYNDIDYCLRMRELGLQVLYTPYACLTHYESRSRGADTAGEKEKRLKREAAWFARRWRGVLEAGDPFYNPNFSVERTDCSLRQPWEQEAWRQLLPEKEDLNANPGTGPRLGRRTTSG